MILGEIQHSDFQKQTHHQKPANACSYYYSFQAELWIHRSQEKVGLYGWQPISLSLSPYNSRSFSFFPMPIPTG